MACGMQSSVHAVQASGLQLVQPLNVRLAEGQQQALLVNYALLLLLAGRTSACETVSSALAQRCVLAPAAAHLLHPAPELVSGSCLPCRFACLNLMSWEDACSTASISASQKGA